MVRFVRDKAAGFLMQKEVEYLSALLKDPPRPFVAVVGGAKVSDKVGVIDSLIQRCDAVLIGGAMAYTLLSAKRVPVGKSRVEAAELPVAERILKAASARKVQLLLPQDHVVAPTFDENATPEVVTEIRDDRMGLDIGPKTREQYAKVLREAKTIFWNGPMGVFEKPDYAAGTRAVAEAAADATARGAISVIGGGDSAAAVAQMGLDDRMTHISTGGGASLKYLEGKAMPPIEVLDRD